MSKYCPNCGKQLPDDALFCDNCGSRMPDTEAGSAKDSAYAQVSSLSEAADLSIKRNREGEWSYWDSPQNYSYDERKLLKYAEKEDKRLQGEKIIYIVSADGAIGHILEDDERFLEWLFYTPNDQPDKLPQELEELEKEL